MAVLGIVTLWLAFAATHMALASVSLRPRLVSKLGERGYQGVYSLVALATFVPMVTLYFRSQHAGPHLWYLGHLPAMRWLAYIAMGAALVLVIGGLIQPSPAGIAPGRPEARGVLRITRHPLFMGVGLFGLVHLLVANLNAAELAFFAGFPIFAVVGCRHQDLRKLAAGDPAFARFHAETAFLPFTGRGAGRGLRESLPALVLGVGLTVLLRWFHPAWFGGAAW
ncbi:MAG: NnrU family protein [Myxococcota bacterium]|nr:NnrU family protein [Myxococcota bacterium]